MRILVSGFEAFGGNTLNPTARLVEWLGATSAKELGLPAGTEVRSITLPVTFEKAFVCLRDEISLWQPDFVIACGQARGRKAVTIERVAINCLDAELPDNQGEQPRDLPIESGGVPAYFSTLPLRALESAIKAQGVDVAISDTAGTYVCNFLMYRLLEFTMRSTRGCGFVHFPILPEQVKEAGEPSMPFEQMQTALRASLLELASLRK